VVHVDGLESSSHTRLNWLSGLSGFPIASTRECSFVASVSTAVHRLLGIPHASSRITST